MQLILDAFEKDAESEVEHVKEEATKAEHAHIAAEENGAKASAETLAANALLKHKAHQQATQKRNTAGESAAAAVKITLSPLVKPQLPQLVLYLVLKPLPMPKQLV